MRLVYYHAESNVGDSANPWLWSRLLERVLDDDPDHILLGIGTVLTTDYARQGKKITVFGSGARNRRRLPDLSQGEWDIRFVRGPKTARITGAPHISDPAILLPRFLPGAPTQKGRGFVPHHATRPEVVAKVAETLGARVISPALGVEDFIAALTGCEEVVSEAMHGAIFADAYRVPWAGVRLDTPFTEGPSNRFKWQDWALSVSAPYRFARFPLVCNAPKKYRMRFFPDAPKLPKIAPYGLSPDQALTDAQDRILEEVERLKAA